MHILSDELHKWPYQAPTPFFLRETAFKYFAFCMHINEQKKKENKILPLQHIQSETCQQARLLATEAHILSYHTASTSILHNFAFGTNKVTHM
jgi:hypothetical protein